MDISYYKKYEPVFGTWRIVKEIGEGSFGKVFEIEREDFGYTYKAALKAVTIPQSRSEVESVMSDGMDKKSVTAYFRGFVEELIEEFRLMSKLKGESNVVSYEDHRVVEHEDGIGWDVLIRMELLTPLLKYSNENRLSKADVINIGIDICKALELCRKHNIIHRDIKPENIFVSENGKFKLGDFGIAKTVEKTTGGLSQKGTYSYMAPEVCKGEKYGSSVDIYSLGIVLYRYLNNNRTPFLPDYPAPITHSDRMDAIDRRMRGDKIPPPKNADEKLAAIVLKACAYEPQNRYANPTEMRLELESIAAEMPDISGVNIDAPVLPIAVDNTVSMAVAGEATEEMGSNEAVTVKDNPLEATTAMPFAPESIPSAAESGNSNKGRVKKYAVIAAALFVAIVGSVFAFGNRGNDVTDNDPGNIKTEEKITADSQTAEQIEWTEWSEKLPKNVTEDKYIIEKQTQYRSRNKETKVSTDSDKMSGWTLEKTAESGEFGAWSTWSQNAVTPSDKRQVETETRYRSRNLETTTGSNSSMSGWNLTDTTYAWSDYGSWSSWSTSKPTASDSRKVESKTQYSARSISYTTQYTGWGSWSGWQDSYVSSNELRKVETRTVYHYYYYLCPHCGTHMYQYTTCLKWAGGCGGNIPSSAYHTAALTTPYSSTSDFEGTGVNYVYSGGERYFTYVYSSSPYYVAPWTQYRYSTRSTYQEPSYGSWSSYSDTYQSASNTKEVRTRTVYRYCDRSQIPTYHFQRWGEWSNWSTNQASASSTKQVDSATFYRYRDKSSEVTYYFWRWSDWSDWTNSVIQNTSDNDVETKIVYRYKEK